jgi:REP element-mobilizing transposase RayT
MRRNAAGEMVHQAWRSLPERFPFVELDEFRVMPNHFHGIIVITRRGEPCVRPVPLRPDGRPQGTASGSVGQIVQAFKSLTTDAYSDRVACHGWPRFEGRLWQRNYYEHIIRDEEELGRVRAYIRNNPRAWESDLDNPRRSSDPDASDAIIERLLGRLPPEQPDA